MKKHMQNSPEEQYSASTFFKGFAWQCHSSHELYAAHDLQCSSLFKREVERDFSNMMNKPKRRMDLYAFKSGYSTGFTLIELMVVVVIVAIFAAIAIPSYARYMERKDLAVVKQEAQKLATELERFKAKNYSYRGFNATYVYGSNYDAITGELLLPVGSTATTAKYTLTLLDADDKKPLSGTDIAADEDAGTPASHVDVKGLKWIIIATRMDTTKQAHNYDLLLNSDGLRCMTKTTDIIKTETAYSSCSDVANSEVW